MKKVLSIILMMLMFQLPVVAEKEISIVLNGTPMSLQEPIVVVEGRTLVPVKFIFEPLGLEVSWNGETRTATGQKKI